MLKTDEYIHPKSGVAIFFLGPYATPMSRLDWAVQSLYRGGYTVITYEYSRKIFDSGTPDNLFTVIQATKEHVQASIKRLKTQGYTEFGFVGSSLGSFIAYNCLGDIPELSWGVLNTGGNITDAIWSFASERQKFAANGYTQQSLAKAWYSMQYPELGNLSGKHYIVLASKGDKTTHYKGAVECFSRIKAAGAEVTRVTHHTFSHRATIVRNLLRIRRLVKLAQAGRPRRGTNS